MSPSPLSPLSRSPHRADPGRWPLPLGLGQSFVPASQEIADKEAKQQSKHNKRYQTNVKFTVNQRVLIRQAGRKSKMHMPYVGPFKIEAVLGRDRYRVRGRRNAKRDHHEFHVSRLKLWPEDADDEKVYLDDLYFGSSMQQHGQLHGHSILGFNRNGYP